MTKEIEKYFKKQCRKNGIRTLDIRLNFKTKEEVDSWIENTISYINTKVAEAVEKEKK